MSKTAPLDALYEHVASLADWAKQWPELPVLDEDWEKRVYVCWNGAAPVSQRNLDAAGLLELMEQAHRANIAAVRAVEDGWKRRNVFSNGRSLRGGRLTVDHHNVTTAEIWQSAHWARAHAALGSARLFLLFTEYSLFYALENNCFHQVAGIGAQNVPSRNLSLALKKQPVDVRFDRGAMYYRQRRDTTILGWPHDHVFRQAMMPSNDMDALTTNLMFKIFERHYGEPDAGGVRKAPKLLRRCALPLLKEMLQRGANLAVRASLVRHCPSRLPRHELDAEEKEAIVMLATQDPYAEQATLGATQAATRFELSSKKDHQPCFLDFSAHLYEVVRFAQQFMREVVPVELVGSESNLVHVLRFVEAFIRAKRLDVISLQSLTDGFRATDCAWLFPLGRDSRPARLSQQVAQQRTQMAHDLLFFLVDGILMPALKFNFFITESSATRNQLHYFRCDDWQAICKPVLEQLQLKLYEPLPRGTSLVDSLGTSVVRLLPKERGMRPIANLGYRAPIAGQKRKLPSINDKLTDTRVVLTFEQKKRPELLGASIYTPDAILQPMLKLKEALQPVLGKKPLLFVKVDIRACFDTLRQDRLLEVMEGLIDTDAEYTMSRRAELTLRNGYIFREYTAKSVLDSDERLTTADIIVEHAASHHRKIYVDQGSTLTVTGRQLREMLTKLVTQTYINFGSDVYRQKQGIPQGSSISTILCSLFYAHLDRHVLDSLRLKRDNLLARLLDDFLFITTREADAEAFLYAMLQRVKPYGAEISKEKSVVNFELPKKSLFEGIRRVPRDQDFAWCGFAIDQQLDVRVDFVRQETTHMADTFSVSTGRNPGKYLFARFYTFARSPILRIALNAQLNSLASVQFSLYQAFLSMAMRMFAYAQFELSARRGVFLRNRHRLLVQLGTRLITSKSGGLRVPKQVDRKLVVALGIAAFRRACSRKGREGQLLVGQLEKAVLKEAKLKRFQLKQALIGLQPTVEAPSSKALDKIRF